MGPALSREQGKAKGCCTACRASDAKDADCEARGGGRSAAPAAVRRVLRSQGRPLERAQSTSQEGRFGHSFGTVRIHDDAEAASSARSIGARAYTYGPHIVFDRPVSRMQPREARPLLAHELAHVVQQSGARVPAAVDIGEPGDAYEAEARAAAAGAPAGRRLPMSRLSVRRIQRDLATEPPAIEPAAQPDLTDAEIAAAIAFNRSHYDAANTRLIQGLLGGPVTGSWTAENIVAVASTQAEFGLHKDGMIGHDTFVFLSREQQLEGASTATGCLTSFDVQLRGARFVRLNATHCAFDNQMTIRAEFSQRCTCAQFQYRQFIRGHLLRTRAGVVTDLGAVFGGEPGGALPVNFTEDTDNNDPVPHFGHRNEAAGALVEDHYLDGKGDENQAQGCRYRGFDEPGATLNDCQPGDSYDVDMNFRGEIQRNGAAVATKFWPAFRNPNWRP